jgi:hypothetical protein
MSILTIRWHSSWRGISCQRRSSVGDGKAIRIPTGFIEPSIISGSRQTFMYANRGMLVEYRADGCYTVFPPSIHESGEAVEFFEAGEPTELKRADLLSQVGKLASATLAALNWQQGSRHDVALALAGIFFKADWPISEAENFMRAICDGAGDKELDDRLGCIRDTYHRGQVGEAMTGWPTLAEHIGNEVAQKVAEWLGIRFTTIEPTTIAPSLLGP